MSIFGKILRKEITNRKMALIDYREYPELVEIFKRITKIKQEVDFAMRYPECFILDMCVRQTSKINGDIVVLGVYQGGSSKLVCQIKGNKKVYVFDTFRGHINLNKELDTDFHEGQFKYDIKKVKEYLKDYDNVFIYGGIFPEETGKFIENKKFSFIHFDFNLYKSTKESIEFFYPKMNRGGIMLFDDYFYCKGVKKAIDEFFRDKPEPILLVNNNQAMITKIKNGI